MTFSPKTCFDVAIANAIDPCTYIDALAHDLDEIAAILKSVYKHDPKVHIEAHKDPDSACLVYCKEINSDYGAEEATIDEIDIDDVLITANWTVSLDNNQFELKMKKGDGNVLDIENYPLSISGYQRMIAVMMQNIADFFPLDIKRAYHEEAARRKNQMILNLC